MQAASDTDDDMDMGSVPLRDRLGGGRAKKAVKYNFDDDDEDSDF